MSAGDLRWASNERVVHRDPRLGVRGRAQAPQDQRLRKEHFMTEHDRRQLDPRTAAAYWDYGYFGDPDGEHSIGRQTFWWDPAKPQETISHCEMYEAWPELSDIDWRRLTHIAYARDGVHLASRELERALAELKDA